jgi:8-oxo-dGTP pyrophosphatase MutT (NUDIX family)
MTDPRQELLARLAGHAPFDDDEARGLATLAAFVARCEAPFARSTLEGHVTGSAVVVDDAGRALLLFHARLAIWVQPGGHLDPGETDVALAALREAGEESGLPDLALDLDGDGRPRILDVDVHPIPASEKRGEPAHFHHDVCFLARTTRAAEAQHDAAESHGLRWVSAPELPGLTLDPATRRRLRKALGAA